MFQMYLTAKKVDNIFEEPLNLHIIVGYLFLSCVVDSKEKVQTSWKNYLISTAEWVGEHNTTDIQNTFVIFLSAVALMKVNFWTEDNLRFISDWRNSFNCKLKNLINKQIIIFYSTSNALCSSGDS